MTKPGERPNNANDHYPRNGNMPMPMVYSTLNKFGDPLHTKYGGKLDCGGCRTGAGTWWPDYGTTVRDFSPGGINHPTEHVFEHEVMPFTAAQRSQEMQRSQSMPAGESPKSRKVRMAEEAKPTQFRHPQPSTEALWTSVDLMPYKKGGRRKCSEASNWKSALSSGAEGFRSGGRTPIWCKGPLLENPDFHQLHPLRRGEATVNISNHCLKEQLAAGTATGTSPVDGLLLSSKTSKSLGMRDCETIRSEMTHVGNRSLSHNATFTNVSTRLGGKPSAESFRTSPAAQASGGANPYIQPPSPAKVSFAPGSMQSLGSEDSNGDDSRLPNWIASSHVASRDAGAAGGQAGPTAIRRIALPARTRTFNASASYMQKSS